jgi:diguanylate cyclase (GGDEF)-like protein
VLAQLTVVIAVVRTGLTFREVRALAASRHEAATDDLTGLPNRRHFLRRLADEVEAARAAGSSLALLVMDLDHFKELNDTLGHHAGDQLLEQVGPRLLSAVRTGDTVARLGGDEFGVLLGAPSDEAAALRVSDAILRAIDQPFTVRDLQLSAAASIGVALFPHHGSHPEELLQRADIAMYQAKASRGGRELYARHRDNHSLDRLTLMADLRTALANGGLELHYQAQAGAHDGIVVGFEALVRWPHPARGLLRPAAFVPLAEQAGLSRRMTGWILDEALRRCAAWRREGRDLHVAVNATVADLLDLDFPGEVAGALRRHRLEPRSLVIEVTEGSFLSDPVRIDGVLTRLRDLGVGLSLDDFGTGFSSLTHLRTLPVHEVKIDRSFVAPMQSDEADAAIVGSTIALAHALGMRVIAEGVEDEATWRALAALGCDLVQGFELAPPLPADQLAPLLDVSHLAWHGDAVPMEPSAA